MWLSFFRFQFQQCSSDGNTYFQSIANCKANVKISTDNIFLGKLTLGDGVTLGTRIKLDGDNSQLIVDHDSLIGDDGVYSDVIRIGSNSIIGSHIQMAKGKIGNKVTVGGSCVINGHLENGVSIGDETLVDDGAIVRAGAIVGVHTLIAQKAEIAAGKKIGSKCCIGIGVKVNVNMPDGHYMNVAGKLVEGIARLTVDGKCVTKGWVWVIIHRMDDRPGAGRHFGVLQDFPIVMGFRALSNQSYGSIRRSNWLYLSPLARM